MLAARERANIVKPVEPYSDRRYRPAVRQLHLYIQLGFKTGYAYIGQAGIAERLGTDRTTVRHINRQLEKLGLIRIEDRNKAKPAEHKRRSSTSHVFPLPEGGSRSTRRKAQTAAALACTKLDLSYRVLWALIERSYHGQSVKISAGELAELVHAHEHNIFRALAVNIRRGWLRKLRTGGGAPENVNEYQVTSTAFRMGGDDQTSVIMPDADFNPL